MEKLVQEKYNKIAVPLFGAAYAAPNKGTTILNEGTTAYAAPNKVTTILYRLRSLL